VPTYQYSCTECGHFFETVQSFSEDSLSVCPECGGRLRKVFNAVGVVFKGSGFYRNDSRGKPTTSEPASSSPSSSTSSNGSGSSSSTSNGSGEKKSSGTSEKKSSSSSSSSGS
jgi:putative FmdB family regulatory protein